MIDGLSTENMKVGTVTASTTLSGADLSVASATIDATELASNSVTADEIAASAVGVSEVSAAVYQAGSHQLSSGSRWVTFGTAFANTNYHVSLAACDQSDGGVELIGHGSKTVGSFVAVGSTSDSTSKFDWIAVARK